MDEKPTKPAQPTPAKKPRRRWYQYSLRTLLIGIAVLSLPCAYVGWQAKIVRERKAFLESHNTMSLVADPPAQPPLIRKLLGDELYTQVALRIEATINERAEAAAIFPEAKISAINPNYPWSSWGGGPGETEMFIAFPNSDK